VQLRNILFNIESSQERVARSPKKRGALGHGLFGLCVNPSLVQTLYRYDKSSSLDWKFFLFQVTSILWVTP